MTTKDRVAAARKALIESVGELYAEHGAVAFSKKFLLEHKLYYRLNQHRIDRAILFAELGIAEDVQEWSREHRRYRGESKPQWTWEQVIKVAKELANEHEGVLPSLPWLRKNNGPLAAAIFAVDHTYEELRAEVDSFDTSHFRKSRSGMRWRSQPETCLSDFLYARGIQHKRGERYVKLNPEHVGNNMYDVHFLSANGDWIDVEIWGYMDFKSKVYAKNRAKKEAWRQGDPNFLGIDFDDCLEEKRLEEILEPYIGRIAPFVFDKPTDKLIETAHWSSSDELIESCRLLAAEQPDGLFPSEGWLRKRGVFADRSGEAYNTMAIYINKWLGGIRNLRKILGQSHASTTSWTEEQMVAAWNGFVREYGISPAQASGRKGYEHTAIEILREGSKIYRAVQRHGLLDRVWASKLRPKIKGKKSVWTQESVRSAWEEFVAKHGKMPSQCLGSKNREILPVEVVKEAQNICSAARKLAIIEVLRGK